MNTTMPISSECTGLIAEALSKAQSTIEKANKESTNPFFKSKYADFGSVVDACKTSLTENGLSFSSSTIILDGTHILVGTLMHSSGEWLRTFVPLILSKQDMQSYGSACTYARRYAMASLCNVATEDDDGEGSMDRLNNAQLMAIESILLDVGDENLREKILSHLKIKEFKAMTKVQYENTMKTLKARLDAKNKKTQDIIGNQRNSGVVQSDPADE